LPPVLPIVIYRGNKPWRCAIEMSDLIEKPPGKLTRYTPQHRYLLVEESKVEADELDRVQNAVAGLIRLEKSDTPLEAIEAVVSLINWLKKTGDGYDSLRKSLYVFFLKGQKEIKLISDSELEQLEHKKLEEVIPMWPEKMEKLANDLRNEGREKWLGKGREEGREEERTISAANLKRLGVDFKIISEATGLTIEEIEKL